MTAINKDDVVWCYSNFLHRLPENNDVASKFVTDCVNWKDLVSLFANSDEFRNRVSVEMEGQTLGEKVLFSKSPFGFMFPAPMADKSVLLQYTMRDYEHDECSAICNHLRSGDVAIDAGARHGYLSCVMAAAVGPSGRVYAFEPAIGHELFDLAMEANGFDHVRLEKKALGDVEGTISFSRESSQIGVPGTDIVDICRLDDQLASMQRPVKLLKLDIEGAEYRAISGATRLIREDRPVLLIEIFNEQLVAVSGKTADQLIDLIESFGYAMSDLKGRALSRDALRDRIRAGEIFNVLMHPK